MKVVRIKQQKRILRTKPKIMMQEQIEMNPFTILPPMSVKIRALREEHNLNKPIDIKVVLMASNG